MLDSFGLVGYQRRPFHWARALGVALLVAGVVLIAKFDGTAVTTTHSGAASQPEPNAATALPPPSPLPPLVLQDLTASSVKLGQLESGGALMGQSHHVSVALTAATLEPGDTSISAEDDTHTDGTSTGPPGLL